MAEKGAGREEGVYPINYSGLNLEMNKARGSQDVSSGLLDF